MDREPRFYIGETVRIRQWNDMKAKWGGDSYRISTPYYVFLSSMQPFCGMCVTITNIEPIGSSTFEYISSSTFEYFVEEDVGKYHLTEEMLEPIEPESMIMDGFVDGLCGLF